MDINLNSINQSIPRLLHRYHVIIFVVVVLGALGFGVFTIYQAILSVDDPHGYTAATSNTTFDPVTQENIKNLHPSDYRLSTLSNPAIEQQLDQRMLTIDGRINPFVE
ncbi:MAG: hypothetical protein ABWX90_03520 [Candidatus Saccharimonadales bacterium]